MMKQCLVCKYESDDLLSHCKTEWHTYNLRRETIGLNSLPYEDFKAKQNDLILKNAVHIPKEHYCCKKVFKCTNTYENHLKSKKHIEQSKVENDIKLSNEIEVEEILEDEIMEENASDLEEIITEPLKVLDCLFCKSSSKTIEKNLIHMKQNHNFTLPFPECVTDLEGLMEYLICLIDEYHVCLQCNKQFDERRSVRNHMNHMNHMRLYFHLESNGDDLCDYYSNLPQPVANLNALSDNMEIEAQLPNGKRIGNRNMNIYFKQNLTGLSNPNNLSITSGPEKARMSLITSGRYGQLVAQAKMTPKEKKYKSLEARYVQLRSSRYSNFQQHYRDQILV